MDEHVILERLVLRFVQSRRVFFRVSRNPALWTCSLVHLEEYRPGSRLLGDQNNLHIPA